MPLELAHQQNNTAGAPLGQCPLCAASRLKHRAVQWKDGLFSRCQACGFIFQDPPPDPAASRAFYESHYYADLKAAENQIRAARSPLYADALRRLNSVKQTGRILDLGAGFGDFLTAAEQCGWQGWGLEPSREACEIARSRFGERMVCGTAVEADFSDGFFDAVTLWNVLDCLPDSGEVLSKIHRWLRPGGVLMIRTPNADFHYTIHRIYRRARPLWQKVGWTKEASVFLRSNFSAGTLRRFLEKNGFKIRLIENGRMTTGDPYGVLHFSGVMTLIKRIVQTGVSFIASCSFGRILAGPNLFLIAERGETPETPESLVLRRALSLRVALKRGGLYFLACLGYLSGLPLWRHLFGVGNEVIFLLYHSITAGSPGEMSVSKDDFRNQLKWLKSAGSICTAGEALANLHSKKGAGGRRLVITFDDGYEDNYRQAFPVLRECKVPALIFLLAGAGGKTQHLGESGYYPSRLITWQMAREMADWGVEFGSHGLSHGRLISLSDVDLKREVRDSKNIIENELGRPVRYFSYPYGTLHDFDGRVETCVREAGYAAAFSAVFGGNSPQSDAFCLKRINVEASDTLFTLRAKLNGALGLLSLLHWKPVRGAIRLLDRVFFSARRSPEKKAAPILLASVDFPPHTDGVTTIARELSCRISARHSRFFVLAPSDAGDTVFDQEQCYKATRVPGYDWGYGRAIPMFLGMPFLVLRRGIRHILALNIAYGGVAAWALAHILKIRYVLFAYGYEFEKVKTSPGLKRLYLAIYARSAGVVCCSENVRERLTAFGVPAEKTLTLYPGVDTRKFFPAPVSEEFRQSRHMTGRRVVLTVGRLVERKGHDKVIQALAQLVPRFPELLYVISGKGEAEAGLKQLVSDLHLENHVRFVGRISDAEISSYYNACEFFVMPSREIAGSGHVEGFGIVFLEAGACGKPSIGGRSGGVAEAIWDGRTGFLVDPESVDELVLKMETLLKDRDYCKSLGENAREWVLTRFHWPVYVQHVYQLLMGEELP